MSADVSQKSDNYIHLPANIVLSKEGVSLFRHVPNQIKRIVNREGHPREGFSSKSFNATTTQKMVMNSYVEEIYVRMPDLLRKRFEIISTNNLIVYAILYRKLSPTFAKMLFDSPVVKDYNRKNPKNALVNLKQIDSRMLQKLREHKKEEFEDMENEVKRILIDKIYLDTSLLKEDREVRIRAIDKFIDWMDERIWYLYFIVYQTPLRDRMVNNFTGLLKTYLDNTQVGIHLSNLVMEFVQNAEKAHFERIIKHNLLSTDQNIDNFLRKVENRNEVIRIALASREFLEISWSISPEKSNFSGKNFRVLISISNYGIINEGIRSKLSSKLKENTDGIALSAFYHDDGDTDSKLGAGLGLLYNSYLEDFCRGRGISYSCSIYPEPNHEKTTVRIELIF